MDKVLLEFHPTKDYQIQELLENQLVYGKALTALIKDMSLHMEKNYIFRYEDEDFILSVKTDSPIS